ncbi:MAG: hypothetical protein JWN78_414 [Bacteroidota bacterium]|nr:hypothetical protein [Bacteroidota bacterium]
MSIVCLLSAFIRLFYDNEIFVFTFSNENLITLIKILFAFLPFVLMSIYLRMYLQVQITVIFLLLYLISAFIAITMYLNIFFFILHGLIIIPLLIFFSNNKKINLDYSKIIFINVVILLLVEFFSIYIGRHIFAKTQIFHKSHYVPYLILTVFFWQLYVGILFELIFNQKNKWFLKNK